MRKNRVAVLSLQNVTKTNWYCTKNFNLYPSFFYDDRARARAQYAPAGDFKKQRIEGNQK